MGGGVIRAALAGLAVALLLSGCAGVFVDLHLWDLDSPVLPPLSKAPAEEPSPPRPQPKLSVTLLPDEDGSVGAVDVTRGELTATLTEPYQTVHFDNLAEPYITKPSEVEGSFSAALTHEPELPKSFTVYFELGSTQMIARSLNAMPAILAAITSRAAPEVSVAGHADRSGSTEKNSRVSRARAEAIHHILVQAGLAAGVIDVQWYGENRLAVTTRDGVHEERNRRVEIRVR